MAIDRRQYWHIGFFEKQLDRNENPKKHNPNNDPNKPDKYLRVFSEGDSWFDYPLDKGGVTDTLLRRKPRISLLRHEDAGDTVQGMLSLKQREKLARNMERYEPDLLLFSGGGNDVFGGQLSLLVRHWKKPSRIEDAYYKSRVNAALAIVRAGYEDLIALRNASHESCVIVTHGYDLPFPSDKGIKIAGIRSWIKPSMDYRGVPVGRQRSAVRWLMGRFDEMLRKLEEKHDGFVYVRTQGTFRDASSDKKAERKLWANEIHPTPKGYGKITDEFWAMLSKRYPLHFPD